MKTTFEISASQLREVRKLAARKGVTLRTLIERGLQRLLAETKNRTPFKLRRATFKGGGLQAEFRDTTEQLREVVDKNHGA
jgi:hypothetical protein